MKNLVSSLQIEADDPRASSLLLKNEWEENGERFRVRLLDVLEQNSKTQLVYELRPHEASTTSFRNWVAALRLYSLSATVAPCASVAIFGFAQSWPISWPLVTLALLAAICFQLAINLLNDYSDHLRLIDFPGQAGGSQVIQRGDISAVQVRRAAFLFLGLALFCGVLLSVLIPTQAVTLALIAAGVVIGVLSYSGVGRFWSFGTKYKALGDVSVFVMCGPALVFVSSWVMFHQWDPALWWISLMYAWAAMAILHANNLEDIPIDRKRGVQTMATLLGFARARWGLLGLYAAFALTAVGAAWAWQSAWFALLLVLAPWAWRLSQRALQASGSESALLSGLRVQCAQWHLMMGVLFSLILFLSGRL